MLNPPSLRAPEPPPLLGAVLPGEPLVLTVNAGGERWMLDGLPLHAGDGVELLVEGEREPCASCEAEGVLVVEDQRTTCPGCAGRGYRFRALWLPVRFEYRNDGDGSGPAFLYAALAGGGARERHAIEVRSGDRLRCRRGPARAG